MWRVLVGFLALGVAAGAAERTFDFSKFKPNETPPGFRSTVTGEGRPGEWRVILDDVPSALPALSSKAPVTTKQSVLAQVARDKTDEHFPLLVFEEESYGDFTLTTRLKTVAGEVEQMAGVAFRIQDERNYYVVRISSLGNNVRFYKFVNGLRSQPIGTDLPVPQGVWHELAVECRGASLRILLNGREVMPALTDTSFSHGKVGFWTKSDSVSYFTDARVRYTPRERLAPSLVRETLAKYSKLRGLRLCAIPPGQTQPQIIASHVAAEVGQAGDAAEKACLEKGTASVGKSRDAVTVVLPLRDRNGDIVAAVRVLMNTFPGQTENNAVARALPVVKYMERSLIASDQPLQ